MRRSIARHAGDSRAHRLAAVVCMTTAAAQTSHLLRQTAGAIPWATFFVLAPFSEFVFVGAILWLPLLISRERRRATAYGFLPGALCRAAVVAVVVAIAIVASTGPYDRRIRGLRAHTVTLGDLANVGVVMLSPERQHLEPVTLTLPTATPSRREVVQAITEQTGLTARMLTCGSGASLLFGSHAGPIIVEHPRRFR